MSQTQNRPGVATGPASLVIVATMTSVPATGESALYRDGDQLLAAALRYAARGWHVFFLSHSKRPVRNCPQCPQSSSEHDGETCQCLTCHAHLAATTDPDRIRAIRKAVPMGLPAIRTGAISGMVVLDVDPRNGGQIDRELMTPTATVMSGRGDGGCHLYYEHPGQYVRSTKLPGHPGIDVKGDGGYVVAPPAPHPVTGWPYLWIGGRPVVSMRAPLVEACCPSAGAAPAAASAPTTRTNFGAARRIVSPAGLLQWNLDLLRRAGHGHRRRTLYGVARNIARDLVATGAMTSTEAWAVLIEAGRAAEQTERDIRAAILGGFRDEGVTP